MTGQGTRDEARQDGSSSGQAGVWNDFDRDLFMREVLRELAGTLQDTIGVREAEGFVAIVGARLGDRFNAFYRRQLNQDRLTKEEVIRACTDLKERIGGAFAVEKVGEDCVSLINGQCPFGRHVEGRPALCMMTSNVFGRMFAENLGYAKVNIQEAIARGDGRCRVVVHLDPDDEAADGPGREYFRVGIDA